MRLVGMLITALFMALAAVVLSSVYAGNAAMAAEGDSLRQLEEVTKVPDVGTGFSESHKGYLREGSHRATCGGYEAGEDAQVYYYGFKRMDGYCETMEFLANDSNEAWSCARQFCSTCSTMEDITDRYTEEEGPLSGYIATTLYCPAR